MKNTVKIFEELNKMKNLIHVKRGIVISEQDTGLDADIVAFRDEIVNNAGFANNVDEKKLVDILKKYATNKNTFQNFQDKFSEKYKYKPSEIMAKSLDMSNDSEEYDDLNNALEKIGLKYTNSGGIAKFEELSAIRQTVIIGLLISQEIKLHLKKLRPQRRHVQVSLFLMLLLQHLKVVVKPIPQC